MAYLLHIETATEQCSVALSKDEECIASRKLLESGFSHAKQLHVFIDEVLNEAKLAPNQIHAVSVSEGPGSFTGLRIGSVAAKGLCFALDIPLIALPTLTVLAAPYWKNTKVVALLDARRDEVYTATFDVGGKELTQTQAHILTPDSYADLTHEKACFVGTGAEKAKAILPENTNWNFAPSHPVATAMPTLAKVAFDSQQFTDVGAFAPVYIKPVRITPSKKDTLGRPRTSR